VRANFWRGVDVAATPGRKAILLLAVASACAATAITVARAADPSALWNIVHDKCTVEQQHRQDPAPCSSVDLTNGYAVLKDIVGATQFLLIPTARVSGIEDPAILAADAPNYWNFAWQARGFVQERSHASLPRDALSLSINSRVGRSQNQLHIHIDCVRVDVRDTLKSHLGAIGTTWTTLPAPLAGRAYRAMRVEQDTLDGIDPFRLLADNDSRAAADMGMHTLIVVGATFGPGKNGFVVLDNEADLSSGDRGSGEELQDHDCAVARAR
jgi:CDP-diacylglycerol pyrophosphatase